MAFIQEGVQTMYRIPACIFWLFILSQILSCGPEDAFQEKNSFSLDTLYADPAAEITDSFQLIWEISIEGYPQFLVDVYLSNDDILGQDDLKIAETADTWVSIDPDQPYVNGLNFMIIPGSAGEHHFAYSHDRITWLEGPVAGEAFSGKTYYLIGRFHHPPGLLIETGRTMMVVEIRFL